MEMTLREKWRRVPFGIRALFVFSLVLGGVWLWRYANPRVTAAMIGIVAPDGVADSNSALAIWLDAAKEEGLLAESVSVSSLTSSPVWGKAATPYRVLILPDQLLRQTNRNLLAPLKQFVEQGGHLLVCFDAFTRNTAGEQKNAHAALADLVGLDYALFDTLNVDEIAHGPVFGSDADMRRLQLPPGKAVPWPQSHKGELGLTTYQYGFVSYPHFVTRGVYAGKALLRASDGSIVLGENKVGRGSVLFANLPLGDLKGRTDGLMLHATLQLLAQQAALPQLAAVPDGIGGLVFNWHIDANSSLDALAEFDRRGLFSQGPFSIHLTTGPDAHRIGDHAGMDLSHNPAMQEWVRRFLAHGDALGNHGGWVHDYFGRQVETGNRKEMISLLERNDAALRGVAGKPILEYSAPLGTQPEWVTEWIEKRGVLAYYFTGNTGMAPTRSYRDGVLHARKIWSFPIVNLNQIASFEEALDDKMPSDYIEQWLISLAEFSANTGTVRTFYSHPTGWPHYFDALEHWFAHTAELAKQGKFRWYTMQGMAQFLNRREAVTWHESRTTNAKKNGPSVQNETGATARFDAAAASLAQMSWRLPKHAYARPQIIAGKAHVVESDTVWTVIADDGKTLRFDAALNRQP